MGLPEGYRPRKGDIVVLHARIKNDLFRSSSRESLLDSGTSMQIVGQAGDTWVDFENVVGLMQRHWEPGDKVRFKRNGRFGEVVAVFEDKAWIKMAGDETTVMSTECANELEDDTPPPEEVDLPEPPPPAPGRADDEEPI